jgi:putative FmdB family regulatory protein
MPMYEFYCNRCNTIFTFFSRSINTEKTPPCPKDAAHSLNRLVSRFAVTGKSKNSGIDGEGDEGMPDLPIDEARMERAMESLAAEAENISDDDPRQAANLMRKLTDMTGLKLGDKMEDALSRMEAGEDPDAIEKELGDIDEKDLFSVASGGKAGAKSRVPLRDETMYEM